MRPLHTLIVAVVLLVAGGLAFYLVRSQPAPTVAAGPASISKKDGAPAADPGVEMLQPIASPETAAPESSSRVVTDAPAPAPRPAATAPKATPVLAGRVQDASGNPVAGASVFAVNSEGFMPMPIDGESFDAGGRNKRAKATTSADGTFELADLHSGVVRLAVRKPGFAPYDKQNIGLAAEARQELDPIALEASVVIEGRVIDSRGRGVGGAKLLRGSDSGGMLVFGPGGKRLKNAMGETAPDGSFRLDQIASGVWSLVVATEDHPDKKESGVTERPGQVVRGLTLTLDDGFEIAGRVTGAPEGGLSSAYVRANPQSRGEGSVVMSFDELGGIDVGGEGREAELSKDGSFVVRGLRDGQSYALQVRKRGGDFFMQTSQSASVTATAGDRGVLLPFQPEGALVFQVIDARTKQPITRFDVQSGVRWPMPLLDDNQKPIRNHEDGRVRVGNLRPKSDSDRVRLTIEAAGYREFSRDDISVALGRETDLGVIALEPAPVVSVTVLDSKTGAPVAGARVTLSEVEDEPPAGSRRFRQTIRVEDEGGDVSVDDGRSRSAKTDEQGVATINSFEESKCRVRVEHRDHAPYQSEVFTPGKGELVERVAKLSGGGSVKLTLLSARGERVPSSRIDHRAPGTNDEFMGLPSRGNALVTNSEGQLVVDSLEPGVHRFRPHGSAQEGPVFVMRGGGGDDEGWSEVEVTEGDVAELTITAPMRVNVAGRIREGGQDLAGARVGLQRKREGGNGEEDMLPPMMMGGSNAKTDGQGRYTLANIESGDYTLTVRHPTRAMPTEYDVHVGDDDVRYDVELPISIIEGRVTDEQGKPLAGLKVWAERAKEDRAPGARGVMISMVMADSDEGGMVFSSDGSDAGREKTDADGKYSLRGVQPDVDLQVHAEGPKVQAGKTEKLRVPSDQTKSGVDLKLDAAGTIEAKALRADGTLAKMMMITARFEGEAKEKPDEKHELMQNGKVTIGGLVPGRWRLSISSIGPEGGGGQMPPEQVIEVKPGESANATFAVP